MEGLPLVLGVDYSFRCLVFIGFGDSPLWWVSSVGLSEFVFVEWMFY